MLGVEGRHLVEGNAEQEVQPEKPRSVRLESSILCPEDRDTGQHHERRRKSSAAPSTLCGMASTKLDEPGRKARAIQPNPTPMATRRDSTSVATDRPTLAE